MNRRSTPSKHSTIEIKKKDRHARFFKSGKKHKLGKINFLNNPDLKNVTIKSIHTHYTQ